MACYIVDENNCAEEIIGSVLRCKIKQNEDDPFYVLDVGQVVRKVEEWKLGLPRVEPFFAVKCNSSYPIIRTLVRMGCGLDVASKTEMRKALSLDIPSDRLIFSNTCKAPSGLTYARQKNIQLTVFDTESELLKIKAFHPQAKLMVRIRYDDSDDTETTEGRFGFGCGVEEAEKLLDRCVMLNLDVVGVSFHVRTGCSEPGAYADAIIQAKRLFDYTTKKGYNSLSVLNLGGGFLEIMGNLGQISFVKFCEVINDVLDRHFPKETNIRIIAEPGQVLAATVQSLFACVIGIKFDKFTSLPMYTLSDGMHGSFRNLVICKLIPEIIVHVGGSDVATTEISRTACSLWGPTCDPTDCILDKCLLPPLQVGQWLEFKRMGAYTNELFSHFNGMPKPQAHVLLPKEYISFFQ